MKTIKTNIQFKGIFRKRYKTERIVLHHSASSITTTIQDMHRWHQGKGWSGLGYHYVIYPDGTIYKGRPEWARGAHAWQDAQHEANTDGLGICLIGNFMEGKPTEAQLSSVIWLIKDIRNRYPGIPVIGHKDVMATACPGKNFPWVELYKRLEGNNLEIWMKKLGEESIDYLVKEGIIKNPEYWKPRLGEGEPPYWLFFTMLRRLDERR